MTPLSFLLLLNYMFYLFLLVNIIIGLFSLLIFSKNQLLISLIFSIDSEKFLCKSHSLMDTLSPEAHHNYYLNESSKQWLQNFCGLYLENTDRCFTFYIFFLYSIMLYIEFFIFHTWENWDLKR